MIITNDERVRIDVRDNEGHADVLRTYTRNMGLTTFVAEAHRRQGRRNASKVVQGEGDLRMWVGQAMGA